MLYDAFSFSFKMFGNIEIKTYRYRYGNISKEIEAQYVSAAL